jgi:hypothetical protein
LTVEEYEPKKFYIKNEKDKYILASGEFDSEQIYYIETDI